MKRTLATLALLAGGLVAQPAHAQSWSDFLPAFPEFPCNDGWMGCVVDGERVSPDTRTDSDGMPYLADMRVAWFSLEPTPTFSPFAPLSKYTGEDVASASAGSDDGAAAIEEPEPVEYVDPDAERMRAEAAAAAAQQADAERAQREAAEAAQRAGMEAQRASEERARQEAEANRLEKERAKAQAAAKAAADDAERKRLEAEARRLEEERKKAEAAQKKAEEEARRREEERKRQEAERKKAEEEARQKAEEAERLRKEKEEAERKEAERLAQLEAERKAEEERKQKEAEAAAKAAAAAKPEEGGNDGSTDAGETGGVRPPPEANCDNLVALEPMAMLGRLNDGQAACLESQLQSAAKMTEKSKISRVLMVNAFSKGDKKAWETLVKRHLEEIDQSDPDICYKYALHLSKKGASKGYQVIKWADVALENRTVWTGDTYTSRVYALYRLRAAAAQGIWAKADEKHASAPDENSKKSADDARNMTKVYAREWYEYAKNSGKDTTRALQLCVSAAGTQDYCEGG